jgi:hypothetical protein
MGASPGPAPGSGIVAEVARAIGRAHEELWPVRKSDRPRLPPEVMFERAADAALAVAREAVLGVELPTGDAAEGEACAAFRDAAVEALGGVRSN